MKKNMGTTDKAIRILIALIIAILFYFKVITGTLGIVLLIVGGISLLTSFINFCPMYVILGIRTCPFKKDK